MDKDHDTMLLTYHLHCMLMSLVNRVFIKLRDAFIQRSAFYSFLIVNLI